MPGGMATAAGGETVAACVNTTRGRNTAAQTCVFKNVTVTLSPSWHDERRVADSSIEPSVSRLCSPWQLN
jgi:hypothetical protein